MATTSDYLNSLQQDKSDIIAKLREKGVEVSNDATFTDLAPLLDEIQGEEDISEYFNENTVGTQTSSNVGPYIQLIKKIPLVIPSNTNISSLFRQCYAEKLTIKSKNVLPMYLDQMCYACIKLISLNMGELNCINVKNVTNMFYNCYSLENLLFCNNYGAGFTSTSSPYPPYTIDLTYSTKLTHDSLIDVINKLYDLNLTYDVANGGTLYTQNLALGSTNLAKLTEEEIAIATNKGWTVL